jgi:hypothetical protein
LVTNRDDHTTKDGYHSNRVKRIRKIKAMIMEVREMTTRVVILMKSYIANEDGNTSTWIVIERFQSTLIDESLFINISRFLFYPFGW